MSGGAALSARGLVVRRSSRSAAFELRVDDLALHAGEALAVLGPNGAGKSTLLRSLAGLETPLRGSIERAAGGPVTMVFQRPIALAGSVEHNLRAALLGSRLSRGESTRRAREALERFGISSLARRRARTLSGGELRRLALARAFALRPAVLLLDEPFDDLDAAGQEALSVDLRRAIDETRVAVAIVTHDLRRALLLADRIAVLLDGRLAQCGERDRVLAHPDSPAVARVVGMANLIPASVVEERPGGPRALAIGPLRRIPLDDAPPAGTAVWIGIRPESLGLDAGPGEGLAIGKAVVRNVLSDGIAFAVVLDWEGHALRAHLLAGRGLARTLAPGAVVTLSLRPEDLHWMERRES